MKILSTLSIITLMLISGVAIAERGSGEDNRIINSKSPSTYQGSGSPNFSPSEMPIRNP